MAEGERCTRSILFGLSLREDTIVGQNIEYRIIKRSSRFNITLNIDRETCNHNGRGRDDDINMLTVVSTLGVL